MMCQHKRYGLGGPSRRGGRALPDSARAFLEKSVLTLLWLSCVFPLSVAGAAAPDPEVAELADRMRGSREQLLRLPGGLSFHFRVDSEQRRERPYFYFPEGLEGSFAVKWPKIHNLVKGVMHGIVQRDEMGKRKKLALMTELEGSYDFETLTSVDRKDNRRGQIIGQRTHHTSTYVYPLKSQHFVEFNFQYFPGEQMQTDLWLPNAIEQHAYAITGNEEVEGIPCRVLARKDMDTIWIAENHGYVVCKREVRWGVGKAVRERTWCRNLEEISPGVWMPMEVTHDVFDKDNAGQRLVRYLIKVRDVEVGKVTDEQLRVVFPEDIRRVEDYVAGTVSELRVSGGDEESKLLESVRSARHRARGYEAKRPWRLPLVLANVVLLLGVAMLLVRCGAARIR